MNSFLSTFSFPHQFPTITSFPLNFSHYSLSSTTQNLNFLSPKPHSHPPIPIPKPLSSKSDQTHNSSSPTKTQDDGIPIDYVKTLVKFKSRYNYIRVLEVSRKSDHPFRGSRLLLLDGPGSAAKIILELYPQVVVHGWEIDPAVIDVGRKYFGLSKLEKQFPDRVFVYIGDALKASVRDGFSGILVDLFSEGSLIPELQDPLTWKNLKKKLRRGGRIMVNVGGSCVEAEDSRRDGKLVMEESLKAMYKVFPGQLYVLGLGNREDDSSLALTGDFPDLIAWKKAMPKSLRGYVDMWTPFGG
ncbi:uncharacterized protein LOC104894336 [Beta vulgaris subsp. vulgaris]|uniref:uncharacterized protein LOC104894336 n=1 Tax=Beta vulgaris subsp. vulgaris TaxID=3555 RepID=UPI000900F11E|nr:uncharacterized protein LOC104894336 [Beta vulgaris subsp. vulgaris]